MAHCSQYIVQQGILKSKRIRELYQYDTLEKGVSFNIRAIISMKRSELSEEKQKEYDLIVEKIMQEIEQQNPDQYHKPGLLDGKATRIYQDTFKKYLPELRKLFE